MQDNEALLLETAGRISDGTAVDWDEAERGSTTPDERKVLRQEARGNERQKWGLKARGHRALLEEPRPELAGLRQR